MSNKKHALLKIVLTFVINAAAGYIIGILFAPSGGKKTRHNIQKKTNKAGEIAKDQYKKSPMLRKKASKPSQKINKEELK